MIKGLTWEVLLTKPISFYVCGIKNINRPIYFIKALPIHFLARPIITAIGSYSIKLITYGGKKSISCSIKAYMLNLSLAFGSHVYW